jgi:hypothetical protein
MRARKTATTTQFIPTGNAMTKTHEKLLIAVLAGIIIAGAGAFAIQPALAGKAGVRAGAEYIGPSYDVLTLRLTSHL